MKIKLKFIYVPSGDRIIGYRRRCAAGQRALLNYFNSKGPSFLPDMIQFVETNAAVKLSSKNVLFINNSTIKKLISVLLHISTSGIIDVCLVHQ